VSSCTTVSGVPGIAGEAAQQLIRGGLRVVDTKNADRFNYAQTQIVVQTRTSRRAKPVRSARSRKVIDQPANQNVADVIVHRRQRLQAAQIGTVKGRRQTLDSRELAIVAARAASDKKAEDIIAIDVAELLVVTDFFVICTGRTDRQSVPSLTKSKSR